MANIGYIQVVRHCNHFCGFCSNPTTPYTHTFESMKVLVDDFVERGYFGVILTGGEPSLHPELPEICRYATDQGLHVRMITNGTRLAKKAFAKEMAEAGLKLVHVSIYSLIEEVEDELRGTPGTLPVALQALDNANEFGIDVNINCVINKLNADHLDLNIRYFLEHHPYIRHFVWNNLDPSMGRAEVNQDQFTPRLADFELSLQRALRMLERTGRTFRVEKVPLCYMTDFGWASTETRKIVKGEERIVHFLDDKQTVRQTNWGHMYAEVCEQCSLRSICGGVFDRGGAYDPAELHPVFVDRDALVRKIIEDPNDPSFASITLEQWKARFDGPPAPSKEEHRNAEMPPELMQTESGPSVGLVTDKSKRLFEAKRKAESKKAAKSGVSLEKTDIVARVLEGEEAR
ncbi:nitrite reductase [Plesiocystis pacifica SIR-1]|uniref:Nitrite reductase n=1 Tax=Plesiocystis pacifica SIR-1 TaxID=391625 RepID=A6FZD3_9BACT|nr:radical SAM protein [Plesiocystis pacifica]EDM81017.1 nitrite reductase [Plesiocystis pacifica SIR-1]